MDYFSTELMLALTSGANIDEFFRNHLEEAINQILDMEQTVFLDYEKWDPAGYNSGNSRNGYYTRTFQTTYGPIEVKIPRDRLSEFQQQLIPAYKQTSGELEAMVIQLYRKGITTREISDLIEKMYGHHYSATSVSNLAKLVDKDVKAFHERQVQAKYVAIYCDATFINVRRDTVSKEALHLLVGIDAEGYKEVLDYALYPTESSENYKEMLQDLSERGLKQVLLFISDGLVGLPNAVTDVFPKAKHQACWTHILRNAMRRVRSNHKAEIAQDLKRVYTAEHALEAETRLSEFCDTWLKRYSKLATLFEGKENLFSFFSFPAAIRPSLYTNNLIESLNKRLKRVTKVKEQFPHEDSLDRTVCLSVLEYNEKSGRRTHRGFGSVRYELDQMFALTYTEDEAE